MDCVSVRDRKDGVTTNKSLLSTKWNTNSNTLLEFNFFLPWLQHVVSQKNIFNKPKCISLLNSHGVFSHQHHDSLRELIMNNVFGNQNLCIVRKRGCKWPICSGEAASTIFTVIFLKKKHSI